jgi:hypothetical protein
LQLTNEPSCGRVSAQAISRWLPTVAARVPAGSGQVGFVVDKVALGSFLRVLRFPLPIFIPPNSPSSHSPGAGPIGQKWPTCRVDTVWTPASPPPLCELKKRTKLIIYLQTKNLTNQRTNKLTQQLTNYLAEQVSNQITY